MIGQMNLVGPLFNAPAMLHEGSRELAVGMLGEWAAAIRAGAVRAMDGGFGPRDWTPYEVFEGVAIIPVRGVLIQRVGAWGWLASLMGISGYDYIRSSFMQALADDKIDGICLSVDSGGGEVAGCFDLVDTIYAARGIKPIWGILDESAYSAAYALASAVDPGRLYVPRTGGTGSVGVIWMHVSIEQALKQAGFEVTLITKGDLKAETSEFAPLSKDAYARVRADVLAAGALFDETVARNRGMKVRDVTATQAGTFMGAAGVEIGFADAVMAPDAAFRALLKSLG